MNHDIDVKKVRINCYRQSKVAGEFMLQNQEADPEQSTGNDVLVIVIMCVV